MDDLSLAWLAGLLEGEGSFLIYRQSGRQYPRIQMNMTDRDVVVRAAGLMDIGCVQPMRKPGGANHKPHYKTAYSIKVTGKRALVLMRQLRPWMGERRGARIDELLEQFEGGDA